MIRAPDSCVKLVVGGRCVPTVRALKTGINPIAPPADGRAMEAIAANAAARPIAIRAMWLPASSSIQRCSSGRVEFTGFG